MHFSYLLCRPKYIHIFHIRKFVLRFSYFLNIIKTLWYLQLSKPAHTANLN